MNESPRWRLMAPHYLNISEYPDGTKIEWEHKETNRENGRAVRKLFVVPLLLNPEDPNDFNHQGEIIVAQAVEGVSHNPKDYIFTGAPTRDMEPLNAAAEAISDHHRARWTHPIETLPANGGMNEQEKTFMTNMMAEFAKQVGTTQPSIPNTSVPREDYDELRERLAKLEALIMAQNKPVESASTRRA